MDVNFDIEKALQSFLVEAKADRDYSSAHAQAMKKIVKSANDLIRNLEKVKEIDETFEKGAV